jgi:cell division protein FtsQ
MPMFHSLPLPPDIRLMNGVATLLFTLCLCGALAALGLWVSRLPLWAVGGLVVEGDVAHQDAVTIRSHLAPRLQGNFLTVDLRYVQRALEELPWVRHVMVRREFPNRLHARVEEHQPVAWWGSPGAGRLLNHHGEIFEADVADATAAGWSQLQGPDEQSAYVYAVYGRLQPAFARMGRRVQRLEWTSQGDWRVRLDNGSHMVLGPGAPEVLLQRLDRLWQDWPTLAMRYGQRDIESVDFRYPNGYALRLRGVSTLTEPPPVPPPSRPAARPSNAR